VEIIPSGAGRDKLVDDEVLGELRPTAVGTLADGLPGTKEKTFEEISSFGVIGD
jgi:hypothetical protein